MVRLVCLITPLLLAASAFGAAKDDVIAAEKNWAAKVVAMDFPALESIYDDGLIYAHSTGTIETKGEYLAKLRNGKQKYTAIDHHKTTVRVHGDAAVVHSITTMKGTNPDGPFDNRLMMIHTWVKSGGHWHLAAHQTTRLAD